MWVIRSNVARIILYLDIFIGIQSRCRNNNIIITMVGPTIYMTNGSSRPYSPSVTVRCKLEDVKLISGSIR